MKSNLPETEKTLALRDTERRRRQKNPSRFSWPSKNGLETLSDVESPLIKKRDAGKSLDVPIRHRMSSVVLGGRI